jgi:hypothetical protein
LAHGLKSGDTGQTGDGHRSDRWPPLVEPVSPYRFFRPTLGRTDDFDNFNREALSVEPIYPRKFRSFSSFLRFCSLNLLQIFYRTFCIHLGRRKTIMWLQGHHRSDRWWAPVRPVLPWDKDFEPHKEISIPTFIDILDMR